MIRHLKVARDTAMKMRTEAMLELKALILAALRERLEAIGSKIAQVRYLGRPAPGASSTTAASAKASSTSRLRLERTTSVSLGYRSSTCRGCLRRTAW